MYFPCCLAVVGAIPTGDLMSPNSTNSTNSSNTFPSSSKLLSTFLSTSSLITTTAIQECSTINENVIADNRKETSNKTRKKSGNVNNYKDEDEDENENDNNNKNGNEHKNENEHEYDSKLKNEIKKSNYVSSRQMTYCVWGQGDKNPKTFSTLSPDMVNSAKIQKSIFLRKFILPSNSHNYHDKDQRQDYYDKRRNNQTDFSEYKNEVKSIEVEKRILLCAWLTLVLKIKDTSEKKVTENIYNDYNSKFNDSNDKIIEETNVSILENNSINKELTDKEINIDKEIKKTNCNEDTIFDFNYCLQKSDLYSIQNKEMNDQYRRDKYEKYNIDSENRYRKNYNDNHSNENSSGGCDRYGRSASRRHDDIDRDNQGPELWGTSDNCFRSNDNNNNYSRRNDNNNNDYNRNYDKNDRRSRGRDSDRERERYDDDNNSERYDNNQSESHNKKRKIDNNESEIINSIVVSDEKEQIIAI